MPIVSALRRSRRPVLVTTLASIALFAVLNVAAGLLFGPDTWLGHATSHAAMALAMGGLLAATRAVWPPARRTSPGRAGRAVVTAGLAALAAAQVVEAVSARLEYPDSGALHDGAGMATMAAFAVVLVGAGLSGVAAVRERAVPAWALVPSVLAGGFVLFALTGGLGG